jgi:hypothetical protein
VHRLAYQEDNPLIPTALLDRCDKFSPVTYFPEIAERLQQIDCAFNLIADKDISEYERYYVPDTHVMIYKVSSPPSELPTQIKQGSVWLINLATDNAEVWSRPH